VINTLYTSFNEETSFNEANEIHTHIHTETTVCVYQLGTE